MGVLTRSKVGSSSTILQELALDDTATALTSKGSWAELGHSLGVDSTRESVFSFAQGKPYQMLTFSSKVKLLTRTCLNVLADFSPHR